SAVCGQGEQIVCGQGEQIVCGQEEQIVCGQEEQIVCGQGEQREQVTLLWERLTSNINCVAFAPDGSLLANGGDDALIQIWNVTSKTLVQTLAGQGSAVHAMAWSPDGKLLAS